MLSGGFQTGASMIPKRWSTTPPACSASALPAARKSRFLHGLTRADLDSVMASSKARRLPANSIVTNQGDPADYFFLLTKGCARYFSTTEEGEKVLLFWFVAGDIFGGTALLPEPSSYLLSAETVKESCAFVWHRNVIRDLVARHPQLQENALCIAENYLAWFQASHMALVSHTARQRLARALTSLAPGIGHKVPGGIELDITNEELANAANVTPFTASRLLSEWQRNGAVTKSRGSLVLRAPQRLFLHEV
jgi:CRP/FNR family transcriptional regulator, nitrogen oxide reductase regulator